MRTVGAGFRYSSYGIGRDPGHKYWLSVARQMVSRFPQACPECIWIVGNFTGSGTQLRFPVQSLDQYVTSTEVDWNEQALDLFDRNDFRVWLQVEPGNANVIGLIQMVLERYAHHPCVCGFGVDVEWYKSDGSAEGRPVSDLEAESWVHAVQAFDPAYRLFLKHWEIEWMPPVFRNGLLFVDDSQQFIDLNHMIDEFSTWGQHFFPAPVAYQFGYPADQHWWGHLQDPPVEIGNAILQNISNSTGLFWVDFSILDVFPTQI